MSFRDHDDSPVEGERGERLTEVEAAIVRKAAEHVGAYVTARMVGVSPNAVARAGARLPLWHSTVRAFRAWIAKEGKR